MTEFRPKNYSYVFTCLWRDAYPRDRVKELVPTQPVPQGSPERVREVKIDRAALGEARASELNTDGPTSAVSRSLRPRGTLRSRGPTPSSGETTDMPCTATQRLWYATARGDISIFSPLLPFSRLSIGAFANNIPQKELKEGKRETA